MSFVHRPLLAALATAGLAAGAAHAQSMPEFKFSAFGTLGAVHSDERKADFPGTFFQPKGAGFSKPTATTVDSKLGAQVDAVFDRRWSAVLQLVSQYHHDNSYTPVVEWANVKFQATPDLSVRAGRTATPTFLISDTRLVGYAQPWVRPPVEVYSVLPITNNDGLDVSYRQKFGGATHTFQAYFGRSTAKLEPGTAEANPSWGINDTVQMGDLTLRAAYNYNEIDLDLRSFNQLMAGYRALTAAPAPFGAQAQAVVDKYNPQDIKMRAVSLAAQYDPGKWFTMAEFVNLRGEGVLADSRSWYVAAGYRFGSFTPYAIYARTKSDVAPEPGVALPAAAPLNAGLNTFLNNAFNGTQATASVGMRWDFMKNTALKLQVDHVELGDRSVGRFSRVQPGFQYGGSVNLYSATLDFVF